MNEKLKNAWDWMKAHKKGIAIGAGVTASVILIAVLLKKCADSDIEADQIQDILDKEVTDKKVLEDVDELIKTWKENGGDELKGSVIDKLRDLHEFAKENGFCVGILPSSFGIGEFEDSCMDIEFFQGDVMVDEFTTY